MGVVAIIGLPFAMLHKIASPHDYHWNGCGKDFARRTTAAKIAWVALLVFIFGFTLTAAVFAFAVITGRVS